MDCVENEQWMIMNVDVDGECSQETGGREVARIRIFAARQSSQAPPGRAGSQACNQNKLHPACGGKSHRHARSTCLVRIPMPDTAGATGGTQTSTPQPQPSRPSSTTSNPFIFPFFAPPPSVPALRSLRTFTAVVQPATHHDMKPCTN